MKEYYDESIKCWRDENDARLCSFDNETIKAVAQNCIEFLTKRNTIYIDDVEVLLEKALEGISDKEDLTLSERNAIKRIRTMLKGL